jgi:hypothetical protein
MAFGSILPLSTARRRLSVWRTWGGVGVRAPCSVRELPVTRDELEFEIQFAHDGAVPGLDKGHLTGEMERALRAKPVTSSGFSRPGATRRPCGQTRRGPPPQARAPRD